MARREQTLCKCRDKRRRLLLSVLGTNIARLKKSERSPSFESVIAFRSPKLNGSKDIARGIMIHVIQWLRSSYPVTFVSTPLALPCSNNAINWL